MTLTPPGGPHSAASSGDTSRELSLLAALFEEAHLPAQSVLTREDEPSHRAFVIIEGRAAVTVGDRMVGELGPGDVVEGIAWAAFASRPATTTSSTPLHVLVIGPQTAAALRQRPRVAKRLAARLRAARDQ
jgi:CRP-like cAMP-binding protein